MLFYLFILTSNIIFIKNDKVIFAEILSRHGARGPVRMDDVEKGIDLLGIKWNNTGELTPIGKRMEYLLGVYNRYRYIKKYKLLSEKFDPHELVIYSSDINRTLLSITSQLQGLYPMSKENGHKIKKDQINMTFPPINITYEDKDIENEITLLNDSALPNYITVIPIHFIILKNTTNECIEKIKAINKNNAKKKKIISNLVEEFNKNYSEKLNKYYKEPKEYDFSLINHIYDTVLVDMTEGNNISEFFNETKIDKNIFIDKKFEVLSINFKDYIFGDDNNEVMLFYNTMIFRKMLDNMKRKIEDDIKGNPSVKNVSDFSRPKMVIISAHDTTLSAHELFFIKYFDLSSGQYKFPTYTSQISYEISRYYDDDNISDKNLTFSNYNVLYYFNGELLLNITFDKFIDKIEKVLWSDEEMSRFCFGDKKILKEEEDEIEGNIIIIIIMGFIILLLVITIIILVIKLTQKTEDEFEDNEKEDNRLIDDD